MLEDFVFLRPAALWLLPLAAVLYWLMVRSKSSDHSLSAWIDPNLLPYLQLSSGSGRREHWFATALASLWLLLVLALAGPSWHSKDVPLQRDEQPLLVVLDLSWSMNATDLQPDRITRARFKVEDLLRKRQEGLTGLIVYSGSAHLAVPLSSDKETILNLLPDLRPGIMPVNGSNLPEALELALATLGNAGYTEEGHLLILSDGVSTSDAQASLEILRASGVSVNIIAFGNETSEATPIRSGDSFVRNSQGQLVLTQSDWRGLRLLQAQAGASLQPMRLDSGDIDSVLAALDSSNEDMLRQLTVRADQSYWLIILALPLWLVIWGRRSLASMLLLIIWIISLALPLLLVIRLWNGAALLSLGLVLLLFSPNIAADAFRNKDQQALELLRAEQYGEAADLFQQPDWRGYARIQQGEYAAALEELQELADPSSVYNRANARLKSLQIEEAITDYQQLLDSGELAPDLRSDAEHNLDIAEQMLELMQQQQQGEQGQQGQDQGQDQQSEAGQDGQQQGEPQQQQGGDGQSGEQQESGQQNQQQAADGNNSENSESAASEQQQQAEAQSEQDESGQSGQEEFNPSQSEEGNQSQAAAQPEPQLGESEEESLREQQQRLAQQLLEQADQAQSESELTPEQRAQIQARQQLQRQLQSIPDEPGGLLRRKFERQARQQPRPQYNSLEDQL